MMQKIAIISFILIFIYLYLYVKLESFNESTITTINNIPQTNNSLETFEISALEKDMPISTQLISEISRVLGISKRRITNLIFKGDIANGSLKVIFIILDPNPAEIINNDKSAINAAILANTLTKNGTFKVFINGLSIILYKLNKSNKDINTFFDNTALLDISDYSKTKYRAVPNDNSLTNFYKLDIDKNFNIKPSI